MTFSFAMCKKILDTLPIGYYCKRRIPVVLDNEAETSYYMPMEDKICISYPIIAVGVEKLDESANLEQAVRSMLYHETSHAILTPKDLITKYDSEQWAQVYNIFEDERIETVLKNYYLDVNFKKQLYDITGGPVYPTTNHLQIFFNAVRFRKAPKKYLDEIESIIYDYRNMTMDRNNIVYNYKSRIRDLYYNMFKHKDMKNYTEGMNEKAESGKINSEKMKQDILSSFDKETAEEMLNLTNEKINEMVSKAISNPFTLDKNEQAEIDKINKTLEILFSNFNKKNNGGNGINTYSGIFNPRAVARNDYRYFERSITSNGNNKFGSLHLNLFLDRSGSFYYNQNITNAIIKTLTNFEKRNKNFSIDIYFINDKFYKAKNINDRILIANGGNNLPENIRDIVAKAQISGTYNYNIVLFDGDAFSDNYDDKETKCKLFQAFDRKQTCLISDGYNQRYAKNFHAAKVIYTDNYTDELIENIAKALKTMLT